MYTEEVKGKHMKTSLLILGLVVLLAGGALFASNSGRSQSGNPSLESRQAGKIAPSYEWYSKDALIKAQQKGRAVVYFWAVWCPTCKVLDAQLKERSNELPEDVTILKTNYDTEKELKKKYQIVQQHTLVQVDKEGNEVTKWIGGGIETIKQQLK